MTIKKRIIDPEVEKNGITLSEKSHKDFHILYGKKNNTEDQIKEFLSN